MLLSNATWRPWNKSSRTFLRSIVRKPRHCLRSVNALRFLLQSSAAMQETCFINFSNSLGPPLSA
jgi:hypothetical protein